MNIWISDFLKCYICSRKGLDENGPALSARTRRSFKISRNLSMEPLQDEAKRLKGYIFYFQVSAIRVTPQLGSAKATLGHLGRYYDF
jgi:hypothetical protein